jgi:hypothetical protein
VRANAYSGRAASPELFDHSHSVSREAQISHDAEQQLVVNSVESIVEVDVKHEQVRFAAVCIAHRTHHPLELPRSRSVTPETFL